MLLGGSRTIRVGVELHAEDKSILRERKQKGPDAKNLVIPAFAVSMNTFSFPKLDTVAQ
jgi:hypothetical protein